MSRRTTLSRARRSAAHLAAAGLALAMTATLVMAAAAAPGPGRLGALPGSGVAFVRQVSAVSPLRAEYVRQQLRLPALQRRGAVSRGRLGPVRQQTGQGVTGPSGETLNHAFTNDAFSHAVVVRRLPFTATTDTAKASRQPGEPSSCGATGGTAWYAYRAPSSATLFADTFGTTYPDSLGVFTGAKLSQLHQVACGSSLSGQSQTGFAATEGQTYWFRIDGTVHGGRLQFHLVQLGQTTDPVGHPVLPNPALSANGRWLAFAADATPSSVTHRCLRASSLSGSCVGLFLTNLRTGRTRRLLVVNPLPPAPYSRNVGGNAEDITDIALNATGRYVAFDSDDPYLVPGDTNRAADVFTVDTRSGRVERDSVASDGRQGTVPPVQMSLTSTPTASVGAVIPTLSADGRYVVFTSNLVGLSSQDRNGSYAVYRHDRLTGRTILISVGPHHQALAHSATEGGDAVAEANSMSANGRRVVFDYYLDRGRCFASGSGTCAPQSWLWTARSGRARPVYRNGETTDYASSLAGNGKYVGLVLVAPSTSNAPGVVDYRFAELDLVTHRLRTVSAPASGQSASGLSPRTLVNGTPYNPLMALSRSGRYIAFNSFAALTAGDTNGVADIYLRDMWANSIVRVSLNSTGGQRSGDSFAEAISADGRTVSYLVATASGESGFLATGARVYVHRSSVAGAP